MHCNPEKWAGAVGDIMAQWMKKILKPADTLRDRWIVHSGMGGGGFGQIFQAYDTERREEVVIKAEPRTPNQSKQVLRMEVAVLRAMDGLKHAPKLFGCGSTPTYNYIVMEYLSRNLNELRNLSPLQRFSRGTTFRIAIQALEALQHLHNCGFLHRDVKPSNFTLGLTPKNKRTVYLIDFGLARQYLSSSREMRLPRQDPGFRGTLRYASLNAHLGKDLGRHDDLWSLSYMLFELGNGKLPWRKLKEKSEVLEMKRDSSLSELCGDLPKQCIAFAETLKGLTYEDTPDYTEMDRLLSEALGDKKDTPLDWEDNFETLIKEEEEKNNPDVEDIRESIKQSTMADAELTQDEDKDDPMPMPQM